MGKEMQGVSVLPGIPIFVMENNLARVNRLDKVPYTNSIGQTINVGDEVVFVAHGTGRVNIGTGIYSGVNVGTEGWNKDKV